jgi:hypothetical protein
MTTMDEILHPLTIPEFTAKYWGRRFLHRHGSPSRFAGLIGWEDLSDALRNHPWQAPEIRIFRDGAPVAENEFLCRGQSSANTAVTRADTAAIESLLRGGGLLAWTGADERFVSLRRLAAAFEYAFCERSQVNVYSAYADSRGFDAHWDDHEVFVLQAIGRKRWTVWERTQEAPLFHDGDVEDAPTCPPAWSGVLEAGDLLYLPRGFWHAAEGVAEPTIHISVGVDRVTGLDLLAQLAKQLRSSEHFRSDLPRQGSAAEKRSHSLRLHAELEAAWGELAVERFLDRDDAAAPAARVGGLAIGRPTVLRWLPPRPVDIQVEETLGRFVEFECMGKHWHLPRWMEASIRLLAARRELTREALRACLPGAQPDDLDQAVARLLAEGLVEEIAGVDNGPG